MAEQETGVKVDPAVLRAAGDQLAVAAENVRTAATALTDWRVGGAPNYLWFGPAEDVRERYLAMQRDLVEYVDAVVGRLNQGAKVFRFGADRFETLDLLNSDAIGAVPGFRPR